MGGCGICIFKNNQPFTKYSIPCKNIKTGQSELLAIYFALSALESIIENDKVDLYSDSQYCINSFNVWYNSWKERDFLDVKNLELILSIQKIIDKIRENNSLNLIWVKGHNNNEGNEIADKLARKGYKEKNNSKRLDCFEFIKSLK